MRSRTSSPVSASAVVLADRSRALDMTSITSSICVRVRFTVSRIWAVREAVSEASFPTSSATTANPRPCSPARAASIAALRANSFVWSAMRSMIAENSPMLASSLPASVWTSSCTRTTSSLIWRVASIRGRSTSSPRALSSESCSASSAASAAACAAPSEDVRSELVRAVRSCSWAARCCTLSVMTETASELRAESQENSEVI